MSFVTTTIVAIAVHPPEVFSNLAVVFLLLSAGIAPEQHGVVKAFIRSLLFGVAFCASLTGSLAGDMYPITLKGTVYGVNDSGQIRGTAVTQGILLQNIADNAGISTDNLALVYHAGGNVMGDTIDVIDRNDGRVLDSIYGFWFGTAFARRALYSADGLNQRRLDYVYTDQSDVALGSAVIDKKQLKVRGGAMRLLVTGSMQWIVMPDSGGPAQICTARFSTGQKLVW